MFSSSNELMHLKWTSSPKNGSSQWRCSTPTDGTSPELHTNARRYLVVVSSPELAMEVLHTQELKQVPKFNPENVAYT
ncbi:hypothetical protein C1H46_041565 [Malus baccata]|uniref:Uncharacterized protein n=2 Tax=Malus TaxID=3749 RepID=A0A498KLQ4_MALDO|nr:hypothetical protein DVH24_025708 [Malus domestica]TQD72908.1 hypothetical protein C1H46_041565 [Malus baccata]